MTAPSCNHSTLIAKNPEIPIVSINHTSQSNCTQIIHKMEGVISDRFLSNLNINANSFISHHNIYPIASTSSPHTTNYTHVFFAFSLTPTIFMMHSIITDACIKGGNKFLLNANAKIFVSELAKKGGNITVVTPEKVDNISQNIESIPVLRKRRISNINKIIIGYLIVNSLRNKFEDLIYLIQGNIGIFFYH